MALCEVVTLPETPPALAAAALALVAAQGKTAVRATDTPGFVVNRLLVPFLAQAVAMHDRGVATTADIDAAMRLGASHPMGPLLLADYVGLDTTLSILRNWTAQYPEERAFFVPDGLVARVAAGKLGRKSGEGYYKWSGNKALGPV